jgi:uncharacterized protein YkwD
MRIPSFFYKWIIVLIVSTSCFTFSYSQTAFNSSEVDVEMLNKEIIKEVNKLRKKVKVSPLQNESALLFASEDHANYMLKKNKLTHKQRIRIKKSPKNRVDFYGQQFNRVGENVQLNNLNLNASPKDKKHPRIDTYENLAEQLVLAWKNSPPHYANMINVDYSTTYTSIAIGPNSEVYACQLFGGSKYQDKYKNQRDTVEFKPDRPWRCWRCKIRPPAGEIIVTEDSTIIYRRHQPRFFFNLLVVPSVRRSRMRFFKPRKDGLAADIIVKSQYTCDSSSYHNGLSNFRGIPIEPVYKKDFNGGIHLGYTEIVLGKVPSYIDEEFEVNLVVIQNKRPCSNTLFNVIPSEFHVDIPLSYGFDPLIAKMKCHKLDTLYRRMYFDKSMIIPRDSILNEIIELIQINDGHIQKIEINGFASIEGTTEGNIELYQKRADFLIEELKNLVNDSTQTLIKTAENFQDFRKEINGTKFEYLNSLNDSELKYKMLDHELSKELEFLLKNHRYVDIKIITRHDYELEYDKDLVNGQLDEAIEIGSIQKSIQLQRIQFGLLLAGKMTTENIESIVIPAERKNIKLLHNRAVMKNYFAPLTVESLKSFRADLWQIRNLKEEDKRLNTSVAIIDYYLYAMGEYHNAEVTFYDSIQKWKNLDEVQQARILLNTSTDHDWGWWRVTGSTKEKDYWFQKVKRYIDPARLDVDKTFEIASYYAFFWQEQYAYNLIKGKIDETENPNDLIFFLKLVHLTGIKLPRKTYLNYFKKIKKYSGADFCTFFNNPALNFQILDDEEIKEIYCQECGGKN